MSDYVKIALILATIALGACEGKPYPMTLPEAARSPYAQRYDLQQLFEHDGCKAYSFFDPPNVVYYVHCVRGVGHVAAHIDTEAGVGKAVEKTFTK